MSMQPSRSKGLLDPSWVRAGLVLVIRGMGSPDCEPGVREGEKKEKQKKITKDKGVPEWPGGQRSSGAFRVYNEKNNLKEGRVNAPAADSNTRRDSRKIDRGAGPKKD